MKMCIRDSHNPGMTQADVRAALKIDKGAAARRAASLEAKGYLVRKPNPDDGRSQLLYATPKAEELKNSKAAIETVFYAWLVEELPEAERDAFCKTLETLYWRSKNQRRAGFPDVTARVQQMNGEERQDEEHGKSSGAPAGPCLLYTSRRSSRWACVRHGRQGPCFLTLCGPWQGAGSGKCP